MARQNVTLSIPKELLRKAKAKAALEDKSLSEFLRESLEEKMRETSGYKRARLRQIKLLNKGLKLGTEGKTSFKREELHAR
jgi:hypothetical protein